jgi:hypothetical protein
MANDGQYSDPPEAAWVDEFDEVLKVANPNPDRVGCPSQDVLIALTRRERPIGDPAYEHLLKCSPCYREFRALQQTGISVRPEPRSRMWWFAAVAAVLLLAAAGAWFGVFNRQSPGPEPQTREVPAATAELRTELDLRKYAVARSQEKADERPPVSLPRGRLTATILLPVGSEPGPYEVQVLDSNLQSKASATGNAEIRDFVTTLRATIDLGSVMPGRYQLALRRDGEEWRLFPAEVR